jgi:glycosyltransferase involved in cell wall biosynthesis
MSMLSTGNGHVLPAPQRDSYPSIAVAVDARYVREKPSGIGVYVQALVDRIPKRAPGDRFLFWAHPLALDPLSSAPNAWSKTVWPGPNSPLPVFWPKHYAPFGGINVFHSPHNMMPRALPCPSVVTLHDLMAIERPDLHMQGIERLAKKGYYQHAIWRAMRQATRLIAPTKATADRICKLVPEAGNRTTVIWEAADPCFRPAENLGTAQVRAAELTGGASPYLLVVGANAPTKRHVLAIKAFAAAVPRPWRLVLLQRRLSGNGLTALVDRVHLTDRVVWLNAIAREDVATLMQAADGLIQPSIYEGFGLPILEAMACGCPVVASDIAPFKEIADGCAMHFEADDEMALAVTLREFVRSPAIRRELSAHGVARARDFSWDRCAEDTLQVYRDAASVQS